MDSSETFDFIIVGAGSAGCILANRLSANLKTTVLLLEAGPPDNTWKVRMPGGVREAYKPGSPFMTWFKTEPQRHLGGRRVEQPRGNGLGGSSSVNGMIFLRGNALDYDRWSSEGAIGWSYREVLPYFKKMETFEGGTNFYRGVGGPVRVKAQQRLSLINRMFLDAGREAGFPITSDVNGAEQEGLCKFDMNVDHGIRASSSYAYLHKAGRRPNLLVKTGAIACRVLFQDLRAVGVEYLQNGTRYKVAARNEVILSAGAFGSPQILMLSGIGPNRELVSHGINPVHVSPGVGENLQDHIHTRLQFECLEPITLNGSLKLHRMVLIGAEWFFFKTGLASVGQTHVGAFLRSRPDVVQPNIQVHFYPLCFDDWLPRTDIHGFRLLAGPTRPKSHGTVRLRSPNPLDPPLIDPNYLSSDEDLIDLVEGFQLAKKIVMQPAFTACRGKMLEPGSEIIGTSDLEAYIEASAESSYHPSCTCRMGKDNMAVVDLDLRVHGVERLRVIDASIMPSIVSSNTNAATMMIAERAADIILTRPS